MIPEEVEQSLRLLGDDMDGAQQGGLLVEGLAGPGHEGGRNAEGRIAVGGLEDEGRAGRVPGGVAPGLVGVADSAGGEGARVRFTLDQLGAGELLDGVAVPGRGEEGVVLLGGHAGERLEPVAVVGAAVFDRPLAHRTGDGVGDRGVEGLAGVDGLLEGHEDLGRKTLEHHVTGEGQAAVDLRSANLFLMSHAVLLLDDDRIDQSVPCILHVTTRVLSMCPSAVPGSFSSGLDLRVRRSRLRLEYLSGPSPRNRWRFRIHRVFGNFFRSA